MIRMILLIVVIVVLTSIFSCGSAQEDVEEENHPKTIKPIPSPTFEPERRPIEQLQREFA